MRIFAVSDLHTDFAENRRRLQQSSSTSYLHDVLVVAGDIADDLKSATTCNLTNSAPIKPFGA
jgi:Icc-related predicted phosphoesterase